MRARPRLAVATLVVFALVGVAVWPGARWGPDSADALPPTIVAKNTIFCDDDGGTGTNCANPKVNFASVGDTVTWKGIAGTHTATSCTSGTYSAVNCNGALFDFPLSSGGQGQWIVPAQVANSTVYYWCDIHQASMEGTLSIVDPTATPTATPTPSPPPTPSPTPSLSPTPSPTPTASPIPAVTSPGQTPSPTPTATITPTPTPTVGPTETAAEASLGDMDCNGRLDGEDVLAGLDQNDSSVQGGLCPAPGDPVGEHLKGDVNCDGFVNPRDALVILLKQLSLPLPIPSGCPGP